MKLKRKKSTDALDHLGYKRMNKEAKREFAIKKQAEEERLINGDRRLTRVYSNKFKAEINKQLKALGLR